MLCFDKSGIQEKGSNGMRTVYYWLGIMVRIDDGGVVWGCSAEGHISHVLSARESSRPMGWSKK